MNAPQLKTKIPVTYTEEQFVAKMYFVKALQTLLVITTDPYSKGNPEFFTVKVMDKFVYKGHDYDEAFKVFDEHLQLLEPLYFKLFPPPARKFMDVEWKGNRNQRTWDKGSWSLRVDSVANGFVYCCGRLMDEMNLVEIDKAQDWCEKTLTELVTL